MTRRRSLRAAVGFSRGEGFALVLVVSLLALLVILVLGLSTLTRVEVAVTDQMSQAVAARQNALLAMNVALGQLQRHAGPDRRVTARSDIWGADIANPHWTGVWDASAGETASAPLVWLVSGGERGREVDPRDNHDRHGSDTVTAMGVNEGTGLADMASGGHVQLVGESSALAEGWVKVPAVPIHAFRPEFGGMRTVGRYAYWVGDEGIKADIGVVEPAAGNPADEAEEMRDAAAREMRRVLAPGQAGGRAIFPGMDSHHADWDRVLTATQWGWPSGDSSINASAARARFHDASVQIRGLLTHTAAPAGNGGLKRDLSRGLNDTGLPSTLVGLGEARAGAPPGWGERSYPLGAVEVDATLGPVIAEVRLRFAVRIDETSRDLQLVPGLSLALYNPYTVFLGTQPLRYELEVSGLPNLADGELTVNGVAVDLNLPEVAGGAYRTAPVVIPPGATILIGGGFEDQAPRWQNGVLRDWTDRVARDAEPITLASAMPISAEGDRIELLTRAGSLDLRLSVWRPGEDQATELAAWSFTYAADDGPLVGDEEIRFGFRAAVDDRDPENWLERDIRATPPVLLPAVAWSAPEAAEAMVSAGPDTDPGYVLFGNNRSERYTLLFEVPRRGVPLMSLGQLQHAYWPGQPAWSLGSAAAVDINREILDRYYFSTIPDHWSEAAWRRGDALPNARMLAVDREDEQTAWLNRDRAATALMVRGLFNLNSTSHRAWAAVLRSSSGWNPMILDPTSAIADPDYFRPRFSLSDRATPYTAFPKFAAGLGFYDLRPTAHLNHSQPHRRSLWQTGHRELKPLFLDESAVNAAGGTASTRDFSEANANALVLRLADNLVRRIRARGRPFASLAELANAGLLQDVIDNATAPLWSWHATAADATTPEGALSPDPAMRFVLVPSRPTSGGLNRYRSTATTFRDIPRGSPAFLSQADMLAALLPGLAVRSDTFRIRAFGEAINPATFQPQARVWAEAWVQRMPEPVAPADAANIRLEEWRLPPGEFGRRFRVIAFRWLSENDL